MARKKSRRCLPAQSESNVVRLTKHLSLMEGKDRLIRANNRALKDVLKQHLLVIHRFMYGDMNISCEEVRIALTAIEKSVEVLDEMIQTEESFSQETKNKYKKFLENYRKE